MLKQRILSAFLLLPLPILALYFGPPWFELVCAVSLTAMGWEWEKLILKLRYGLYNGEEYTQREIAAQLGISRSYVSRIEKSAVEKLKIWF